MMGTGNKRYAPKYWALGVDAEKRHLAAFRGLLRPSASGFIDLFEDPEVAGRGLALHVDGAGSKPVVAYIYYRETGDPAWFSGLAQDVLAMNVDDAAAEAAEPLLFADYVAYNSLRLRGDELLPALAKGLAESLEGLRASLRGTGPSLAGGETAEMPDQVRTLDVSGALLASAPLSRIRSRARAREGYVVVGLRSGGEGRNSGIMCNGMTLARHVLLSRAYSERYPEVDEPMAGGLAGRFMVDDYLDELGSTVGEALLSPTRIFAPVPLELAERCREFDAVHITGGGLTKLLKAGSGVRYVLNAVPDPDPVFSLIRREGRISWREMYATFNMGVGFAIAADGRCAEEALSIAERHGIEAAVIGRVEGWRPGENVLTISGGPSGPGKLNYRATLRPRRSPLENG